MASSYSLPRKKKTEAARERSTFINLTFNPGSFSSSISHLYPLFFLLLLLSVLQSPFIAKMSPRNPISLCWPKHQRLNISPCLACHFSFLQSGIWLTLQRQLLRILAGNALGRGYHLFLWLQSKSYIQFTNIQSPTPPGISGRPVTPPTLVSAGDWFQDLRRYQNPRMLNSLI